MRKVWAQSQFEWKQIFNESREKNKINDCYEYNWWFAGGLQYSFCTFCIFYMQIQRNDSFGCIGMNNLKLYLVNGHLATTQHILIEEKWLRMADSATKLCAFLKPQTIECADNGGANIFLMIYSKVTFNEMASVMSWVEYDTAFQKIWLDRNENQPTIHKMMQFYQ